MHACHLALSRIAIAKQSPTYGQQPLVYLACKSARRKTKARKANYLPLRLPFLGSSGGGACFLPKLKNRATYTPAFAYQGGESQLSLSLPFQWLAFFKRKSKVSAGHVCEGPQTAGNTDNQQIRRRAGSARLLSKIRILINIAVLTIRTFEIESLAQVILCAQIGVGSGRGEATCKARQAGDNIRR